MYGCWAIYLFLHLIDEVSVQDPIAVSGVVGGSVILPCSYKEKELKPEDINIFWRYYDGKIVYDIINNNFSTNDQNEVFKGRVDSFPSDYVKGNFSIRLNSLNLRDQGELSCSFPMVDYKNKVKLQVQAAVPTPDPKGNSNNSSTKAQPEGVTTVLMFFALYLNFGRLLYC